MAAYTRLPENVGRNIRLEPEAHKVPHYWQDHPLIHPIYQQHTKQWQGKTNKKDLLTQKIASHIRAVGSTKHADNFHKALADCWLMIILFTGLYRGIEWVQDRAFLN